MDPWSSPVIAKNFIAKPVTDLAFEDNFNDKLPDSAAYLAILETKLKKLKSDPNVLSQLTARREACMQQLLSGDFEDERIEFEAPVANSTLVRTLLPQQPVTQGELLELVKHDRLAGDEEPLVDETSPN